MKLKMAETTKKNPRKSKLVHRDCVEIVDGIDEVEDAASKLQVFYVSAAGASSTSLLPKIKNAINEDDYCVDTYQTPVKFSVEVEVEEFEEDDDMCRPKKRIRALRSKSEAKEIVIPTEIIKKEIFKLMQTTTSVADKLVEMEICNAWGKFIAPPEKDDSDLLVQNAFTTWKFWVGQSKNRAFILAYKCYVCSLGWWHFGPFLEHIKIHKDVTVKLETFNQECFFVAACGDWFENICQVLIEGICPLCLKTYEQHLKQKQDGIYYLCEGCNRPFPTCKLLFHHEGVCFKFAKQTYENVIPVEGQWRCKLCGVLCLTELRYTGHQVFYHSPRSDVAMMTPCLKECHHCGFTYVLFHVHTCAKKASNFMCGYCCRRYQNAHMLQMHTTNTQADYYCKICNKFLKKRCMEIEHVVNHSRNYMSVYKCLDCVDNVLVPDLPALSSHRCMWHGGRKADKRRPYYELLLVPRICMSRTLAHNKHRYMTSNMVVDKKTSIALANVGEKDNRLVSDSVVNKIALNRQENITMQADENDITRITKHITDKMLRRLQSKNSHTSSENESSQSSNPVDELQNAICSLQPNEIKKEKDDETWTEINENDNLLEVGIDDADINETESSVNALLGIINIKKEVEIKQEVVDQDIDIEEQDLSHFITVEDSQESCSGWTVKKEVVDAPDEENVERKDTVERIEDKFDNNVSKDVVCDIITIEDSEDDFENAIVKTEITSNTNIEENKKPVISSAEFVFAETRFKTEVEIKEEKEDYTEFDGNVEDAIEREQNACLRELSKVFQVSKSGTVELSGICFNEEDKIKEEPIDEEDYEDDIIVLNNSESSQCQSLVTSESMDPDNSDKSVKEPSSDTDPADLKPNIDNSKASFCRVLKYNQEIRMRKQKLYRCNKCDFTGEFREYNLHKTTVCPRSGHKNRYKSLTDSWSDIKCSRCSTKFTTIRKYLEHHCIQQNNRPVTCPQCGKTFKLMHTLTHHVTKHIKAIYKKLQLLTSSSYISTRNSGLYQCKVCNKEVYFMKFFRHWENHMNEKSLADQIYDSDDNSEMQSAENAESVEKTEALALKPEMIKKILAQLLQPAEKRNKAMASFDKRCVFCAHVFERRNDCKRHLVEHLLRDAFAQRPAVGHLKCQHCGHTFPKAADFKEHMRCHGSLPVFRCEMCDKAFSDSSNFAKHKKVHNLEVLVCDICKKKFHAKKSLEQHMEVHRFTGPVSCALCRREFPSPAVHRKHIRTVHVKGTNRFLCAFCRTGFPSVKTKWDHMWEVHKQRSSNADCPVCDKSFRKFHDVRLHMREVHGVTVTYLTTKAILALQAKGETSKSVRYMKKVMKTAKKVKLANNEETLVVYEGNDT